MYALILKEKKQNSDDTITVAMVASPYAPDIVKRAGKLYVRFSYRDNIAFYTLASVLEITLFERILDWVLSRVAHT